MTWADHLSGQRLTFTGLEKIELTSLDSEIEEIRRLKEHATYDQINKF